MNVVSDNLSITIQGFTLDADALTKINTPPFGTFAFAIDEVRVFDADASQAGPIELSNVSSKFDSTEGNSAGTASVVGGYKVAKAVISENVITDFEIGIQLLNLSIAATESYLSWSEQLATVDQEDPQAVQQMLKSVSPIVYQIMANSPKWIVSPLRFTANEEPFESDFRMTIDGSKLPAATEFDFTKGWTWHPALGGNANASISEPLATTLAVASTRSQLAEALADQDGFTPEQINEMATNQALIVMEGLVGRGLIQRTDGTLGAQVSWDNGVLLLNGQPMPFDALMGGAPSP